MFLTPSLLKKTREILTCPETSLEHSWNEISIKFYPWNAFEITLKHLWNILKRSLKHSWITLKMPLEHPWDTLETPRRHLWNIKLQMLWKLQSKQNDSPHTQTYWHRHFLSCSSQLKTWLSMTWIRIRSIVKEKRERKSFKFLFAGFHLFYKDILFETVQHIRSEFSAHSFNH